MSDPYNIFKSMIVAGIITINMVIYTANIYPDFITPDNIKLILLPSYVLGIISVLAIYHISRL